LRLAAALRFVSSGLVFGATVVLSGCGGGSRAVPAVPAASSGVNPAATTRAATFSIKIPSKVTVATRGRAPQYVSEATLSGVLTINGGSPVYVNFAPGSANCASSPQGGQVCTFSAPAPIGTDTASLTLYDGGYTGTAPSGNPLSTAANFSFTVTEGQSNVTVPLVLNGIPVTVQVAQSTAPSDYAANGVGAIALTISDADGNTIVGPGTLVDASGNPISITLTTEPGSGFTLSTGTGSTAASSISISDPTQDVIIINGAGAVIGTQVGVATTSASITSIPSSVYVQMSYPTSDYDPISLPSSATAGSLQGGSTPGYVSGTGVISGNAMMFSGNGSTWSGCTTSPAVTDTAVANSGTRLVGIVAGSSTAYGVTSATSGTFYPCIANGLDAPTTVLNYSTMTFLPDATGPFFNPAFFGVEPYNPDCILFDESYAMLSPAGPACTAAFSLTFDTSWLATAPLVGAYGYTNGFDGASVIRQDLSATSNHPDIAQASNLGGVAVRDGVVWLFDGGYSGQTPRLFEIATPGGSATPISFLLPFGCYQSANVEPRTFVIGEDGRGYIAAGGASCSGTTGLEVINLANGSILTTIAPGVRVNSVATDALGHIYFDDTAGNLYRYPSTTDLSGTLATRRRVRSTVR
jgi:hypothetical protein